MDDPNNYRPISLVCVAYKLFTSLLLRRLQDGGAEDRLTNSQFGFRRKLGTNDAIFAVRRHIELALAQKNGTKGILALDWKKAFDSINIGAMHTALKRYGIPEKIQRIIASLYEHRMFAVRDGAHQSDDRSQRSGISQGCPLSPFLFTMTMSIIVEDAINDLTPDLKAQIAEGSLSVLLYADDTLLIGSSSRSLQRFLDAIARAGLRFGLELHWDKFQLLEVNGSYEVKAPDGSTIHPSACMKYLG